MPEADSCRRVGIELGQHEALGLRRGAGPVQVRRHILTAAGGEPDLFGLGAAIREHMAGDAEFGKISRRSRLPERLRVGGYRGR